MNWLPMDYYIILIKLRPMFPRIPSPLWSPDQKNLQDIGKLKVMPQTLL